MDLQNIFNLVARSGKASPIFVPQKQQPSYIETAQRAPQKASPIFVGTPKEPSLMEIVQNVAPTPSSIFVSKPQQQPFVEVAGSYQKPSSLFTFPQAQAAPKTKARPARQKPAPAPVVTPAGTVQPGAIVQGLTPKGTVDRRQSDEYKSQLAQYRNLIAKDKEQEAEDLGMKIWMQKYGDKGLGLTGPNPLMQDFGGFVPTQGPTPAVLQADESLKGVNAFFPGAGPEAFDPAAAQEMQQFATADQADMATTAGMSAGDRARALTRAYRLGQI